MSCCGRLDSGLICNFPMVGAEVLCDQWWTSAASIFWPFPGGVNGVGKLWVVCDLFKAAIEYRAKEKLFLSRNQPTGVQIALCVHKNHLVGKFAGRRVVIGCGVSQANTQALLAQRREGVGMFRLHQQVSQFGVKGKKDRFKDGVECCFQSMQADRHLVRILRPLAHGINVLQ